MPEIKDKKSFRFAFGRAAITFPNGITLSMGNDPSVHYIENRRLDFDFEEEISKSRFKGSSTNDVEVAIILEDKFITKDIFELLFNEELGDDVKGWVKIDQIVKLLVYLPTITIEKNGEKSSVCLIGK
jgi:hypothetical protein